jgi:glycosyltransferase involved in cell wall biosynthesis
MKVCHVVSAHLPSDPRVLHKLAIPTAEAGHATTIITSGDGPKEAGGVSLRYVPRFRSRLVRLIRCPLLLQKALATHADLYHVHDLEFLPWALLLQKLSGKPVVYDVREFWDDKLLYEDWVLPQWRALVGHPAVALELAFGKRLAGITATMEGQALRYRHNGSGPDAVILHNYPDLSAAADYTSATQRGDWQRPTVIYLGWMVRLRGYEILLKATQLLRERIPNIRVVMLGWSSEKGLSAEAMELRRRLINEGVIEIRDADHADIWQHLVEAHVGWIPWLPAPNMQKIIPVKLLEYMAVGLPVVASDFGLMARLIREADCGKLVPADNYRAHTEALECLLNQRQEAARLGENGRNYVWPRFDLRDELPRMWDLYRRLAHRK